MQVSRDVPPLPNGRGNPRLVREALCERTGSRQDAGEVPQRFVFAAVCPNITFLASSLMVWPRFGLTSGPLA
ncbi:hypothetical protein MTDSW087_04616 [Methylobacterium dankookense]|uniref:Uncharacterized protein n=1 Tax=Methylobacterium dankookense TaxID=560405 RepID=A0A564G4J6_9HYPH|nr:hypothetical protein IFDJLNFL_5733 [Methylobacterium dankookense]VUF14890.1 hypothetical protein MTDSW087_04616 [Methylobacterium dankookense]